jgi:hypothetical protein
MDTRHGKLQVREKGIRQVCVVVLPGTHDARLTSILPGEFVIERRDLDKVWSRGGDGVDD